MGFALLTALSNIKLSDCSKPFTFSSKKYVGGCFIYKKKEKEKKVGGKVKNVFVNNYEIHTFGKILVRIWCKLFALGSVCPFCAPVNKIFVNTGSENANELLLYEF